MNAEVKQNYDQEFDAVRHDLPIARLKNNSLIVVYLGSTTCRTQDSARAENIHSSSRQVEIENPTFNLCDLIISQQHHSDIASCSRKKSKNHWPEDRLASEKDGRQ
jgi:hypothetical protein